MSVFDVLRENLEEEPIADIQQGSDYLIQGNAIPKRRVIEIVNQVEQEYNKKFEPMNDLIKSGVDGDNHYLKEQYRKGYEDSLNAGKWVPCSEMLPKESNGVVLICTKDGTIDIGRYSEFSNTWYIGDMCGVGDKVIAWQPLPPKYEPKGE